MLIIFLLIILRACYFLFITKSDPIKAVIPKFPKLKNWFQENKEQKESDKLIQDLS